MNTGLQSVQSSHGAYHDGAVPNTLSNLNLDAFHTDPSREFTGGQGNPIGFDQYRLPTSFSSMARTADSNDSYILPSGGLTHLEWASLRAESQVCSQQQSPSSEHPTLSGVIGMPCLIGRFSTHTSRPDLKDSLVVFPADLPNPDGTSTSPCTVLPVTFKIKSTDAESGAPTDWTAWLPGSKLQYYPLTLDGSNMSTSQDTAATFSREHYKNPFTGFHHLVTIDCSDSVPTGLSTEGVPLVLVKSVAMSEPFKLPLPKVFKEGSESRKRRRGE